MDPTPNISDQESIDLRRNETLARMQELSNNVITELNGLAHDCRKLSRNIRKSISFATVLFNNREIIHHGQPVVTSPNQIWHKKMDLPY